PATRSAKSTKPTSTARTTRERSIERAKRARRPRRARRRRTRIGATSRSAISFIPAGMLTKKGQGLASRPASVGFRKVAIDGHARGDGGHHGDQEGDAERTEIADRSDREAPEQGPDLVAVGRGHRRPDDQAQKREQDACQRRPG